MKLAILFLLATTAAAADPARPPTGSTAKLDHPVAIVERTAIWQSELDETFAHAAIATPTKPQIDMAIDALVDAILIDHTAETLRLTVTDAELDAAVNEIKRQNNIDDAGLDKALADQHFTREQYRVELGRQVRAQKMFQVELVPHITVTEDEVKQAYAKAKAANAGVDTLEKIHDTIKQMVWSEKLGNEQQAWIKRRRAAAHVERTP